MGLTALRLKVMRGLAAKRARVHRYTIARWAVGVGFTVGVALLPLLDVMRLDLWGGRHMVLGRQVTLVEAAKAFAFPFLAINILIILQSRLIGRYLCGFVCPVGALARLSEWLGGDARNKTGLWLNRAILFALSGVLAAITFAFWVDWHVFVDGSNLARALSAGFLAATWGILFGMTRGLELRFCRDLCPSGVYFAVLGPKTLNGVEFAHPEACTDCKACEAVCPMDLEPRELEETERGSRGFYPDGLSSHALCIRCGDCVAACEGTTARNETPTPLRLGWLATESSDSADEGPASESRA